MTNREFFVAVSTGSITDEVIAHATDAIEKLDTANAKRREKSAEKSKDYSAYIDRIVDALGADAMTASDILAMFEGDVRADGKPFNVQFVSFLCREAVAEGKAKAIDVKVKGKGSCKAYTLA